MAKQKKIELNRLRVVLAEKNLSNKWLASELGYTEPSVSRWVNNIVQPPLDTLYKISLLLEVELRTLIAESTLPKK